MNICGYLPARGNLAHESQIDNREATILAEKRKIEIHIDVGTAPARHNFARAILLAPWVRDGQLTPSRLGASKRGLLAGRSTGGPEHPTNDGREGWEKQLEGWGRAEEEAGVENPSNHEGRKVGGVRPLADGLPLLICRFQLRDECLPNVYRSVDDDLLPVLLQEVGC